ncbi:MAG: NAD-dependent epimerase/dehydratase family protein [bacterium]|nr:NAD-dependent epimerase/dehydratase family protein [bacterium]
MNILVTGGTGFLGRHLVPHLEKGGNKVTIINSRNCDLREKKNLLQFKGEKFDRIYHLAAWTKAGDFCLYHQGEQWIINQEINTNMLWFWKEFQPQSLMIAMGTSCAYPDGDQALKEDDYMKGEPPKDLYTYAMTKRMLLSGLRALQKQFGMQYRYCIPSTLYGPLFETGDNHFIFDLIKKIYAGVNGDHPVVLWGDGHQVRELIFASDAVRLIEAVVEKGESDIFNLGSGEGQSIREYAAAVSDVLEYDSNKIKYDTEAKYIGMRKRVLDTKKTRKLLPDFKFTAFRTGLAETVLYYKSIAA